MFEDKSILILGLGMQGKAALFDILMTTEIDNIIAVDGLASAGKFVDSFNSSRVIQIILSYRIIPLSYVNIFT